MFGRKKPQVNLSFGQQAREFAWAILRMIDSPEALEIRAYLSRAPYSDEVQYATISGYLMVVQRVPNVAEDFRATVIKIEERAPEDQVALIPVLRSALSVLDWGSLSYLQIESCSQAHYLLFMLATRLMQSPEAYAQLKALDEQGYWDQLSEST